VEGYPWLSSPQHITLAGHGAGRAAGHKLKLMLGSQHITKSPTNHVNITAWGWRQRPPGILCADWWMAAPVTVKPTAHHTRWPTAGSNGS
jgi:hypothetical protein